MAVTSQDLEELLVRIPQPRKDPGTLILDSIRYHKVTILCIAGTSVDILVVKITLPPLLAERSMRGLTAEMFLEVTQL